uniref:Uncharacterized protein n=1 Tax=Trichogramma kaykai TaxID=54128 RepID=A0ABD2XBA1_9HYME
MDSFDDPLQIKNLNISCHAIVRGTIHQGDARFSDFSRGIQCTAMAAASIVISYIKNFDELMSEDVDEILSIGDGLFIRASNNRIVPHQNEINADYLAAEDLQDQTLEFNAKMYKIDINNITYGHVVNDFSEELAMPNLIKLLQHCLEAQKSGILTINAVTVSILTHNNKIGVFDSHSRGYDGKSEPEGVACFISSSVEELFDIITNNYQTDENNFNDQQYQFTSISVIEVPQLNEGAIIIDENAACVNKVRAAEKISKKKSTDQINLNNLHDDCNNVAEDNSNHSDILQENELDYQENGRIQEPNDEEFNENIESEQLVVKRGGLNKGVEDIVCSDINMIANMSWIWNQLHKAFDNHDHLFSCKFKNIKLIKISNHGLRHIFTFKCDMCSLEKKISNVPETKSSLDLNVASIIACQTTGFGLYKFEELMGI